jgi:hypothetical protein
MPNDVFRAIDATLVLGVEDANLPEGSAADALISEYDLSNTVGRLHQVTVSVLSDVKPFYEIGRRYPSHLRPGVVRISGTAERAHVNGALLRLLLGEGALSPPGGANFVAPRFNSVLNLQDPARPEQMTRLTVFGMLFAGWDYYLTLDDDFVMERVSFQALRIAFEEQ